MYEEKKNIQLCFSLGNLGVSELPELWENRNNTLGLTVQETVKLYFRKLSDCTEDCQPVQVTFKLYGDCKPVHDTVRLYRRMCNCTLETVRLYKRL